MFIYYTHVYTGLHTNDATLLTTEHCVKKYEQVTGNIKKDRIISGHQ